jgi:hypothetical protein
VDRTAKRNIFVRKYFFGFKLRCMEKFFTTEQAAIELGVTPTRTRQLIRAGILKAQQYRRVYLVTLAAIAAARNRHDKPGPIPKAQQSPPWTARLRSCQRQERLVWARNWHDQQA